MSAAIKLFSILLCAITNSGCTLGGDQFSIKVLNFGHGPILRGVIVGEKYRKSNDKLPVDGGGAHSFFPDNDLRVPEQLIADWSTPDGRQHHAVIDLGIPGSDYVAEKYDVPRLDQRWHILVAYMDNVVKSGWVVYDARYKKKPDYFGRHVLFGGDEEVLMRDHMLRPELLEQVPRYTPARN